MNRFFQYINEVLESLDIRTNIDSNSKKIQSTSNRYSKNNYLKEK
ncbi:hypothetical protein [Lacinutrix sp.]|nr:hypothetical protein [Lacinutrix sp.]MDG1715890.1 hypothetical protein [Lacinutrix sp.]